MESETATQIPIQMWQYFNDRNWDAAQELLSENFEAYWPQSNEKFASPKTFIEVNRTYPGSHKIEIVDSHYSYDQWEHSHLITTEVLIESQMPDGKTMRLFAISFFEVIEDKIVSLKEYFADTYPAPEWRKHLVAQ